MRFVYLLEGLCCANCAAKIEDKVGKISDVESAKVSFMTMKLTIEADEGNIEEIEPKIVKTVKKIEPKVRFVKV